MLGRQLCLDSPPPNLQTCVAQLSRVGLNDCWNFTWGVPSHRLQTGAFSGRGGLGKKGWRQCPGVWVRRKRENRQETGRALERVPFARAVEGPDGCLDGSLKPLCSPSPFSVGTCHTVSRTHLVHALLLPRICLTIGRKSRGLVCR